jgi:predicted enzyme related to lactoylglutathione lyase
MANPNAGRFAWHELMTTDPAAAGRFYGQLFGWTVQEQNMGPAGVYRLFKHEGKEIGGCIPSKPGMPSAWLPYVAADDVDATVARVTEHHGKVIVPPTSVPDVRFSVATDPQGAVFGVLQGPGSSASDPLPSGPPAPGTFCWDELHTRDQEAAGKFYGAVFHWTGKVGEGDPMKYWHWMHAGKDIGGMMTLMQPDAPPHWLCYIATADVDASAKKAEEHGAKLLMPAMDVPEVGKFAVLADPTGAAFALFRSHRV